MAYKVLDIYRDLPRTNCSACGKSGCFTFASSVYLEGTPLSGCPELPPALLATMEEKLQAGREAGDGPKTSSQEQALAALSAEAAAVELACLAPCSGAVWGPGPPETLELSFLDAAFRLRKGPEGTVAEAITGEPPTLWIKLILWIYVLRAKGTEASGRWVAFRELPGASVKALRFDHACERLAARFGDRLPELDEVARSLGARAPEVIQGSADRAYVFRVLPRVEFLLLVWDGQEEFPARASLLVDRTLHDYLDPEAAAFAADCFAARLLGQSLSEVAE
jgi:hypothetical protein